MFISNNYKCQCLYNIIGQQVILFNIIIITLHNIVIIQSNYIYILLIVVYTHIVVL